MLERATSFRHHQPLGRRLGFSCTYHHRVVSCWWSPSSGRGGLGRQHVTSCPQAHSSTSSGQGETPPGTPSPPQSPGPSSSSSPDVIDAPGEAGAHDWQQQKRRGGAPQGWIEGWKATAQEQTQRLAGFGLAGVVAYGLLNTVYYSCAFLFCWVYVAQVPRGQGLGAAAAAAFLKVFATVWAGSQVTKLARAGGALALAPVMDRALEMGVSRLGFRDKKAGFLAFLAACLTLAASLFATVIFVWR